jgi:uncharacterized protein (TIGR00156 family)
MKIAYPLAALFVVPFAACAQSGGFIGADSSPVVTAVTAADRPNESNVRLVGQLIEKLGDEKYLFRDDSGTIVVEIDNDDWNGIEATSETRVEISGEVDREWRLLQREIEIDVDSLRLAD